MLPVWPPSRRPFRKSARAGLGIGLALVRQLVELHGGEIQVRSDGQGSGCTFTVALPRIEPPRATSSPQMARQASACRVLLVEDNADARETMAELLRVLGYEIAVAEDGANALRMAAARAPDVIVMDLGLPGMSGHAVAAAMRRMPALRHVPMIALSGYGQERDKQASFEAGFDQHLVKPIDPDALVHAIEAQLARGRARSDRPAAVPADPGNT